MLRAEQLNFRNPEARKKAQSLVGGIREAVAKRKEEGVKVSDTLFQRTLVEGRELRGMTKRELAAELRVSDQGIDLWLNGEDLPVQPLRRGVVESIANEIVKRYRLGSPQQ